MLFGMWYSFDQSVNGNLCMRYINCNVAEEYDEDATGKDDWGYTLKDDS